MACWGADLKPVGSANGKISGFEQPMNSGKSFAIC